MQGDNPYTRQRVLSRPQREHSRAGAGNTSCTSLDRKTGTYKHFQISGEISVVTKRIHNLFILCDGALEHWDDFLASGDDSGTLFERRESGSYISTLFAKSVSGLKAIYIQ